MEQLKKNSLLFNLIRSHLVVIIIPIIALGALAFYISRSIVLNQTTAQDMHAITQVGNHFDTMVTQMENISLIPYSSTQLTAYMKDEDESFGNVRGDYDIHYFLYSLKATDFRNYTFILKSFNSGIVYCNNYDYVYDQDYPLDDLSWVPEVLDKKGASVLIPTYTPDYYMRNEDPVFAIARQINNNYAQKPLGYMILNCRADVIDDIIPDKDDRIFIQDDAGNLFYPYTPTDFSYIDGDPSKTIRSDGTQNYLVSEYRAESTGLTYTKFTPYNQIMTASNQILQLTGIIVLFAALMSFVLSYLLSRRLQTPIQALVSNMKANHQGQFKASRIDSHVIEIDDLNQEYNNLIDQLNRHIETEYRSAIRRKDLEFKLLQGQISPHFLFNTLEALRMKALINDDPKETADLIQTLGSLYRYSIRVTDSLVPLEDELKHIEGYIQLQQMCLDDGFLYDFQVHEDCLKFQLPQLTLQPIIENCFLHAFKNIDYVGQITLKTYSDGELFHLTITDNGQGISSERLESLQLKLKTSEQDGHIGLVATAVRLKHHFPGGKFTIVSPVTDGIGTTIDISLPIPSQTQQ